MAPNPALAQAAQQQPPIAQAANAAGENIARAGRHEQRLQNTQPGQKLEALGERVKETAMKEVPKAGEALAQAQQAAQAAPAVTAASEQLQQRLGELQAAAGAAPKPEMSPQQAQAKAQAPTQPPGGQAPAPPGQSPPPAQANASAPGTPASAQPAAAQAPAPQTAAATPQTPAPSPASPMLTPDQLQLMPQLPAAFGQNPNAPATPVEQMWMARTLDALDAAMHATPPTEQGEGQGAKPGQNAQGQQQQQQPGKGQQAAAQQGQGKEMAQAKQAMNSAAQAAAAAMRASRGQKPSENSADPTDDGPEQAVSRMGSKAQADAKAYNKLANANGKDGNWGKLPKKVAEQLTRGQNENVAGEYRNQVETYYRVIAEKSKKP